MAGLLLAPPSAIAGPLIKFDGAEGLPCTVNTGTEGRVYNWVQEVANQEFFLVTPGLGGRVEFWIETPLTYPPDPAKFLTVTGAVQCFTEILAKVEGCVARYALQPTEAIHCIQEGDQ